MDIYLLNHHYTYHKVIIFLVLFNYLNKRLHYILFSNLHIISVD